VAPGRGRERRLGMAHGVYMIVAEDKIIYVGKTNRSFEKRFKEHKRAVEGLAQSYRIHEIIRDYKEKGIRPYLLPLHVATNEDSDEDISYIEHHYIDLFKPIGN
jgi:hypothetical protein